MNVSGNTATFEGESQIYWNAYQNDTPSSWGWEENFGGEALSLIGDLAEYTNIGGNTWRMERTRDNGKITRTVITFTSATSAQVERYDEYRIFDSNVQIRVEYTLTKQ